MRVTFDRGVTIDSFKSILREPQYSFMCRHFIVYLYIKIPLIKEYLRKTVILSFSRQIYLAFDWVHLVASDWPRTDRQTARYNAHMIGYFQWTIPAID